MEILIVDDDKLVCASLKTILEAGEAIQVAGTGNSGREASFFTVNFAPTCCLWTSVWTA